MKYLVKLGGQELELTLERSEAGATVALGDRTERADLVRIGSSPVYSMILGERSYEVSVHRKNGEYEIVLEGATYKAKVLDERAMRIAAAGGGEEAPSGETVRAPMPGVVVGVAVEVGAEVAPGQGVVTLEAMKMENELKSAGGGIVREVNVAIGQGVAQGEVLVVIE